MKKGSKKFYYLESSAALAWLMEEKGQRKILQKLEEADTLFTSIITLLEVKRFLTRSRLFSTIPGLQETKFLGAWERTLKRWDTMDLNSDIQRRVTEPFPVEPLRTLDAIHLATAIEFAKSVPQLQVLTLDRRIISNLEPLGLPLANI